jgi:ethanolamine utilization protein EutN
MHIGKVIGSIVATTKIDSIRHLKILLVQPLDEKKQPAGDEIAAVDTVQAGVDDTVFYVTGREASLPLKHVNPVDAAIVGIIDSID